VRRYHHTDVDADRHGPPHSDGASHTHAYPHSHRYRHTYANQNRNCHAGGYSHCHANRDCDAHPGRPCALSAAHHAPLIVLRESGENDKTVMGAGGFFNVIVILGEYDIMGIVKNATRRSTNPRHIGSRPAIAPAGVQETNR
jgi:hypothetical protein